MMLNYDKSGFEPKTLPSIFPMILANSNDGIAVGYAVSLPSHNLKDIANTTIFKLNNPEANTKELMKYLKGPDYSTGG
jgi:DNA gyrase subunit A